MLTRSASLVLLLLSTSAFADPPGFVQVLVPFDTVTFTEHPAKWTAELRVRNASDTPVNLFPARCSWLGREEPCTTRIDVPARTTTLLDVLSFVSPENPGVLLYVPIERANDVQFDLRIWARSRGADVVGTSIPVVRSSNYRMGRTTMINVPIGSSLRLSLRVYTPDLAGGSFNVKAFSESSGELIAEREYLRMLPTDPGGPVLVPATFDFSDVLAAAARVDPSVKRISVVVERTWPVELPYWPMISITNPNDEVTVLTPN